MKKSATLILAGTSLEHMEVVGTVIAGDDLRFTVMRNWAFSLTPLQQERLEKGEIISEIGLSAPYPMWALRTVEVSL